MQVGDSVTKKYIYLMLIPVLSIGILAFSQKGKGPKKCQPNKNRVCIVLPVGDQLPTGFVGLPYSVEIRVEGGIAPYTWRIGRNLPPGLEFTVDENGTLVITGDDRESVVAFLNRLKDSE